jgi:hypothetical protein
VFRHRLEIMSDENAIQLGSQREHVPIADAVQAGGMSRKEINRGFAP